MIILGLSAINNTKAPMELSLMVCADCFGLRTQLAIAIQGDISTADQITDSRLYKRDGTCMKWIDVNERTTDTVKYIYIYIYKGYGPVGPLIISYHHDMRVIQGLI